MKKFIAYILIFGLVILSLITIGEIYVEHIPNPAKDKHAWMKEHAKDVRTLILGSSHTYFGIRPDMLGRDAVSLAMVSQSYSYDNYLLRHYNMPKLKTVILPFSYFSLWEDIDRQKECWFEAIRYRLYMDCDIHSRLSKYGFEFMSRDTFKEKLKSIYTPATMTWDKQGWGTNYTIEKRRKAWDNGKERAKNNTYPDDEYLVNINVHYLQSMIEYCNDRGVRLILVTTPVSESFRKNEDKHQKTVNRLQLHTILSRNPSVIYLNLEADSRFTDNDFFDADHLNTDGATKLTSLLSEYIQK